MDKLNLVPILRNHIGEKFYSLISGEVELDTVSSSRNLIRFITKDKMFFNLDIYGCAYSDGECLIFPSKTMRNWEVWDSDNNKRIDGSPKTWKEHLEKNGIGEKGDGLSFRMFPNSDYDPRDVEPQMEISKTTFKIMTLIDNYYGGYPYDMDGYSVVLLDNEKFTLSRDIFSHVAFKTRELANEFMTHHENLELVRKYYMM